MEIVRLTPTVCTITLVVWAGRPFSNPRHDIETNNDGMVVERQQREGKPAFPYHTRGRKPGGNLAGHAGGA